MTRLLLATNNPGKLIEMRALLGDLEIELITPQALGMVLQIEEVGETYRENAALKALAYARSSKILTLGDDSGLEVDALGGAPGLHSARYVNSPGATDADRRRHLLGALADQPRPWTARFCCVVALADASGQVDFSTGTYPGVIIPDERGENGFGYDPIFYLPALGRTMAELEMSEKNRISHRAKAVLAAHARLVELLEEG